MEFRLQHWMPVSPSPMIVRDDASLPWGCQLHPTKHGNMCTEYCEDVEPVLATAVWLRWQGQNNISKGKGLTCRMATWAGDLSCQPLLDTGTDNPLEPWLFGSGGVAPSTAEASLSQQSRRPPGTWTAREGGGGEGGHDGWG